MGLGVLAVPETYIFRATGQSVNGIWQNVRHFTVIGVTGASVTQEEAAQGIGDSLRTAYRDLMSDQATIETWGVQQFSKTTGQPLWLESLALGSLPTAGLVAGDLLPGNVAGLTTLQSGLPGRANRGRIYFPCPSEADSTVDGEPAGTYLTRELAFATLLINLLTVIGAGGTADLQHGIYSASQQLLRPVFGAVARRVWGSQRRRRKGIGI